MQNNAQSRGIFGQRSGPSLRRAPQGRLVAWLRQRGFLE